MKCSFKAPPPTSPTPKEPRKYNQSSVQRIESCLIRYFAPPPFITFSTSHYNTPPPANLDRCGYYRYWTLYSDRKYWAILASCDKCHKYIHCISVTGRQYNNFVQYSNEARVLCHACPFKKECRVTPFYTSKKQNKKLRCSKITYPMHISSKLKCTVH